jgi:hypothetical protein
VLRAFRKAHVAALASDSVLDQFRLFDWERTLARVDPGFRDASPVSRLDAFFVAEAGGLRFTEYNAETPAGGAYNDVLTEVFFGLPVMRDFMRTWDWRPLPARPRRFSRLRRRPRQPAGAAAGVRAAGCPSWRWVPAWRSPVVAMAGHAPR